MFDREGFLERLMGDAAIAQEVIAAFLKDLPRQIALLKTALAAFRDALERQPLIALDKRDGMG